MAISPKMLAILQKVDAARVEHFADLRASAERDAERGRAQKAAKKTQAAKKPQAKPPSPRRTLKRRPGWKADQSGEHGYCASD